MKSSDKPEISKRWWTKEKPAEIKGADLEKALASCESALGEVKKKESEDTIAAALKSLEALNDAVEDTIKEVEKKKLKDVATVLGKFDKLIAEKTKELEKCQAAQAKDSKGEEEEDEEEGKTVFKPEYLARMIKMLRGGEQLQFAMGLNKQTPADSCLVLCNKRKSERLFKMLKQKGEYATRLLTFGSAAGDGKILNLTLSDNAKEPSQIVKTAKEFFKGHRDLKYRKIRVHCGGETFEEDMPEEAGEEQSHRASAQSFEGSGAPGRFVAGENYNENGTRVSAGGPAHPNKRQQFVQARLKWNKARNKAEQDLEVVKDGIRDHYLDDVEQYPIAVKKLKELDDIFDNLSHDLRDALDEYVHTPLNKKKKLEELAASARELVDKFADYVEGSDLLTAIDKKEFADVEIKAPLSAALRELEKTLA